MASTAERSPQERAWRQVMFDHIDRGPCTGARRFVEQDGTIRLSLYDHTQGNAPVRVFHIDTAGRVTEDLLAPGVIR